MQQRVLIEEIAAGNWALSPPTKVAGLADEVIFTSAQAAASEALARDPRVIIEVPIRVADLRIPNEIRVTLIVLARHGFCRPHHSYKLSYGQLCAMGLDADQIMQLSDIKIPFVNATAAISTSKNMPQRGDASVRLQLSLVDY
jgi:hypothetical protein